AYVRSTQHASRWRIRRADLSICAYPASLMLPPADSALNVGETKLMRQPPTAPVDGSSRLDFIDNLRWVMIVLVVSMHAAVTYSHVGSWYFMEDPKPGPGTTALFATYQAF